MAFDPGQISAALRGSFPGEVGVEPLAVSPEETVGRLVVEARHLHPGKIAHGGVWVTLADTVAAWGTMSNLDPGVTFSTVELKMNVFASAREGDELVATARPLHIGGRTQVWSVAIATGERDAAFFTCTQMVLGA